MPLKSGRSGADAELNKPVISPDKWRTKIGGMWQRGRSPKQRSGATWSDERERSAQGAEAYARAKWNGARYTLADAGDTAGSRVRPNTLLPLYKSGMPKTGTCGFLAMER